jgi:division protein CdvB (Snf7/Vps24/ESCRT-III family)
MFQFGAKKPTPQELAKQAQRDVRKSQRELDREKVALDRQEATLVKEIKAAAKQNPNGKSVTILAKQLIQTRNQRDKIIGVKSTVGSVGMQVQAAATTSKMVGALGKATATMGAVNEAMNLPKLQETMRNFEMESEKMKMKEEMMDDALIDAVGVQLVCAKHRVDNWFVQFDGESEEEDAIVNQALEEIGLDLAGMMSDAPANRVPAAVAAPAMSLPAAPTALHE